MKKIILTMSAIALMTTITSCANSNDRDNENTPDTTVIELIEVTDSVNSEIVPCDSVQTDSVSE